MTLDTLPTTELADGTVVPANSPCPGTVLARRPTTERFRILIERNQAPLLI